MQASSRVPPEPLYLCMEIDQFPAQVIAACEPRYRNTPFVVVRQRADSHHSRVWACSRAAADIGIRQGMPVRTARRRRGVAVVPWDAALERMALEDLACILCDHTPAYEVDARGTCVADLSGTPAQRNQSAEQIALGLFQTVRDRIGLEALAIGASRSRLVARLMARASRPCGIRICRPGEEEDTLAALAVRWLPGLSATCRDKLRKYGLKTIGQVRCLGRQALVRRFGREGERLYSLACGVDVERRAVRMPALQAETVLDRDINDDALLVRQVRYTADKLCYELKTAQARTNRLTFALTYTDGKMAQKTVSLPYPTHDYAILAQTAVRLFEALYQRRAAIKSIRLTVNRLKRDTGQLDLFETARDQRQRRLEAAMTDIRKKMGFHSVLNASYLKGMVR